MKILTIRALLFGVALAVATALVPPTASAASPNLFASVAGNGTLVHGNGVSSVTHIVGTGQYEVTFTSDVSSCAYVSTTHHAFSQAIQSFTAGGHLSSSGVYVEVKNQGCGLMDGPFDLAVACNMTGLAFRRRRLHRQPGPLIAWRDAEPPGRWPIRCQLHRRSRGVRLPCHRR